MKFKYEMDILKAEYFNKAITYNELKEKVKPLVKAFNSKAKELAVKHNTKPKLFNLSAFMR